MCRPARFDRLLIFIAIHAILVGDLTQASDLGELLWGGRGSRTTVTDPHIPPPLATDTNIPMSDTTGLATTQSNLMLGTPGAMTLPPGGVIASNGVASNSAVSSGYVIPTQFTTASNIIPPAQIAPSQSVIDYEWTYSTIKDVTYEHVTVYDPNIGGYVTIMQEKQTESVLPWLHRKQVVRNKPVTADMISGSPIIGSTSSPVISGVAERRIVNRLFPVSTVPSPPAQVVPVQTFPLSAAPVATFATESPVVPTIPPTTPSTFDLTPEPYSTTISSQHAEVSPTSPGIISPSAHQVLHPIVPASGVSSSTINTSGAITPGHTPTGAISQASTPTTGTSPQTSPSPRSSTPANVPTLAPVQLEQPPAAQATESTQPTRLQGSLSDLDMRLHTVELPQGEPMPPPAQSSPIPSLTLSPTLGNDIPLLKAPDTETSTPTTPSVTSTTPSRTRPDLSVSPTRRSPLSK